MRELFASACNFVWLRETLTATYSYPDGCQFCKKKIFKKITPFVHTTDLDNVTKSILWITEICPYHSSTISSNNFGNKVG